MKDLENEIECLFNAKDRVDELKQRVSRCCCKYCGNALTLRQFIFHELEGARIEIYCPHCQKIEYGVEPEIYRSAERFVESMEYNYFPELNDDTKRKQLNIAKVCEIISWAYQDVGLLNKEGFTIPVKMQLRSLDGCYVYKSSELEMRGE